MVVIFLILVEAILTNAECKTPPRVHPTSCTSPTSCLSFPQNDDADASVDGSDAATEHRRSADLLSSYMKGKQITVKRNFKNDKVSPGVVNGAVLEEKLQEQFRVFLDGEKEWIGVKRDSKRPEYQEGVKKSKSTAEGEDLILAEGEHEVFVNLEGGMQVPLSVNVVRR